MFHKTVFIVFVFWPLLISAQISRLLLGLHKVTDFALDNHKEINFDGLLGFVIAEGQIFEAISVVSNLHTFLHLKILLDKFEKIRATILPELPQHPSKMVFLKKYLLEPEKWKINKRFINNSLENLHIYEDWSVEDVIKDKSASYKGVPSDHCLKEVLAENCRLSSFCKEMMLAPRIDKGYLLTHRIFYLQVIRLKPCNFNKKVFRNLTRKFCSLILRETKTNAYLGFPAHDIVLEQIVLCGIEGFGEFLNKNWQKQIIQWQTPFGCYQSEDSHNSKRASNVIAYGCSDHTTGLGAAALALNINYELHYRLMKLI